MRTAQKVLRLRRNACEQPAGVTNLPRHHSCFESVSAPSVCLRGFYGLSLCLQIQYFGLQYRTKEERFEWVDRDKPLRKQLEKYSISSARNAELQFGVQFYTTDVTTLKFEITRSVCICDCVHSL